VVAQEAALGLPAVADRAVAVAHPGPVDALLQHPGERADLGLVGRVVVEVAGRGQHAGDQERRVDAGELALPGARAGAHVEEVEVEAAMARGLRRARHVGIGEEAQGPQRDPDGLLARQPAALDGDRVGGEGHAHAGDAAGAVGLRRVQHEAAGRIGRRLEVAERAVLGAFDQARDVEVGTGVPVRRCGRGECRNLHRYGAA
jgi:hypothetical protein